MNKTADIKQIRAQKLEFYAGTLYGKYLEQRYTRMPYDSVQARSHDAVVKPEVVQAFECACELLYRNEQLFRTDPDSKSLYDAGIELLEKAVLAARAYFGQAPS